MIQQPESIFYPKEIENGILPIDATVPCMVHDCENAVLAGLPNAYLQDEHHMSNMKEILNITDDSITFHVTGDSMVDKGIHHNDSLIARRCNCPEDGQVVIAILNGGATVKEFHRDPQTGTICLIPHNPAYTPITIDPQTDSLYISAVVEKIIHDI